MPTLKVSVGLDQFWDGRQIELFVIYSVCFDSFVGLFLGQRPETIPYIPGLQ